jgi:NAD(P)-dependent dehydrogenase (short-subunit alcohol dehydrogenase family)
VTRPAGAAIAGRTALVAGASGGIGAAIVRVLAEERARVTLSGRREGELRRLAGALNSSPADVLCLPADLRAEGAAQALVDRHLDRFATLDVLVVAAGSGRPAALDRTDALRRMIDLNVLATADLVAAALPALRSAGAGPNGALVVLLSSVVARRPERGFAAYSASKAAVSSLARSVNADEGGNGVRATALCPGYVDTPLTALVPRTPIDRFLPADDIAEAVRFLLRLSPAARIDEIEIARRGVEAGRP